MKRNYIVIGILLSIVGLTASCVKNLQHTELASVASDHIVFGGGNTNDVIITRSGNAAKSEAQISNKELKSQSGDVTMPLVVEVQQGIHTSASLSTRATITDNKDEISELDAWAIYTEYEDEENTKIKQRYLYFDDMEIQENGAPFVKNSDGKFYPATGYGPYLWITESDSYFNFVTVTPSNSGFKAAINILNNAVTFDYTVPADPAAHKDILVASPDQVATSYGQSVPLTFKHVMAAVNLKIGSVVSGTITSIKLTGVRNKGSYFPDGNVWTNTRAEDGGEFSAIIPNGSFDTEDVAPKTPITNGISFLMIPQQLASGAEIVVGFIDGTTGKELNLRASLQGDIWEMNTTTNYLINIDGNYNLSIVPLDKVLDSHYIITKVEVSSEFPNWTLMASANDGALVTVLPEGEVNAMAKQGFWTDKYASRNGNGGYDIPADAISARGGNLCRGTQGEGQIIYVFIPENVTGETRTITLKIEGSGAAGSGIKTLTLTQEPVVWMDPTGNGNTDEYWGCELLLEGGQVPWGFCWDGITEKYITMQGNQTSVPPGQLKHVEERLLAAGFNLDQLHDPNFYIQLIQKSNNNQGWLLQIDYSKIGNIEIADDYIKGHENTEELYSFDGISILAAIKEFIANQDNIVYTIDSGEADITNTLDFAAMYAIKTEGIEKKNQLLNNIKSRKEIFSTFFMIISISNQMNLIYLYSHHYLLLSH